MFRSIFKPTLFAGTVSVVTGGGSGIGYAIARELLSLGGNVLIASRDGDKVKEAAIRLTNEVSMRNNSSELTSPMGHVLHRACNIRNDSDVKELMNVAIEQWGTIDHLVNNAGGQFPSPAAAISTKGWNAVIETNLTGTFYCCQEAYKIMQEKNKGSIVNIIADMFKGFPNMAHTGAARAAVDNLTKSLSVEWASDGIRVNAVAPGIIYSDSAAKNYSQPGFLESAVSSIPVHRLGTPEEISAAVCFLLSPGAAYITGSTIRVDGASSLAGGLFSIPDHNNMHRWGGDDKAPAFKNIKRL